MEHNITEVISSPLSQHSHFIGIYDSRLYSCFASTHVGDEPSIKFDGPLDGDIGRPFGTFHELWHQARGGCIAASGRSRGRGTYDASSDNVGFDRDGHDVEACISGRLPRGLLE